MMQRIVIATHLLVASLAFCEASLVKMGLQKDKMPVEIESVLPTFERARSLQFYEMRKLQTPAAETEVQEFDFEDSFVEIKPTEANHSETVKEFVEQVQSTPSNETSAEFTQIQQGLDTHAVIDLGHNQTVVLDMDQTAEEEGGFFSKTDTVADDLTGVSSTPVAQFSALKEDEDAEITGLPNPPGPRGPDDNAPKIDPTEIQFMIVMDDFQYSDGVTSLDQITLGTKFGFTGRIVTDAEELGDATGVCTVTSAIQKEMSYCDIYMKIDTDNMGGFGTVVMAGTADSAGGRMLVSGTGGTLQRTQKGYGMIMFDTLGNPVIYVLLKLL